MTTFPVFSENEKTRAFGFVLSEANGQRSRANLVVASGQGVLPAGQVMKGALTALQAYTDGSTATAILGYGVDATDEAIDVAGIVRDAEVNLKALTFPEESTSGNEAADVKASLKLLGIICRDVGTAGE